jgi:Uma2 family endonuclease
MADALPKPWTLADYLAWEREQPERYEFVGGVLRAMVGGTLDHNTIARNIARELDKLLRPKGCRVFTSDVKVVSFETGQGAYPDVVATCARQKGADTEVTDPALVAEVLSRSTGDYDRGSKLELYKEMPSLRYVLLVAQDRKLADVYRRTQSGWEVVRYTEGAVPLDEFGGALRLDEIYADVEL